MVVLPEATAGTLGVLVVASCVYSVESALAKIMGVNLLGAEGITRRLTVSTTVRPVLFQ
jgi:hypothetical protein